MDAMSPGGGGGGGRHDDHEVDVDDVGDAKLGMSQWRLVPSGIQAWNTNIIATSPTRFAYCSTLAIYVLDLDDPNVLKHLIAGHERTITGGSSLGAVVVFVVFSVVCPVDVPRRRTVGHQ